ncbi:MAG: YfhO family protein, partial [Alphaproteobacteria bacterium]
GVAPAAGLPWVGAGVLVAAGLGLVRSRRRPLAWAIAATTALLLARIFGFLPVSLAGVRVAGSIQFVKYAFPLYLGLALLAGLAFPQADAEPSARVPAPRMPRADARAGATATPSANRRPSTPRRWLAWIAAAAIVAELAWNCRRPRPERVPLWTPAPWVDALRALERQRPGRISGPVDLAPPLVSAALGFRDLRSIDVLTPGDAWRSVQDLVAPSRGVTWITADPDPLLAATSPGAAAADLRWILARKPFRASDLPGATRTAIVARRLPAMLSELLRWKVDTADLSGGLDAFGGEERFHWTCLAPCRLSFDLRRLPPWFAVGVAARDPATVVVRLEATTPSGARSEATGTALLSAEQPAWRDFRVPAPDGEAGRPGRVVVTIESDRPTRVFAGGVGPAPTEADEQAVATREVAWRQRALQSLEVRHSDADATIYENPGALGPAWVAREVLPADGEDAVLDCVRSHPGEPVACVSSAESAALGDGWPRTSSGRLSLVRDGAEATSAEVETENGGVVVFSRLFHPGWHATVDGNPAPLVRVGGGLSAVPVAAGRHRVELAYRPATVIAGAALSLVGVLAIAWLARGGRHR